MTEVLSISATRVPATDIRVGDKVVVFGMVYCTVEWVRQWSDGGVYLAGIRNTGEPHVSNLSAGAKIPRIFDLKEQP